MTGQPKKKTKHADKKKNLVLQKIDYRWALLIAVVAFALYSNTLKHGYVLDDSVAITNHQFVQKGFAGISDILKVDLWHFSNLTLGYYRPFSLITFAIEHEFFGNNPHISHLINVLLYALTGFMLCLLFMDFFIGVKRIIPFLICLLFIAHPVHTEVIANLKSRDEILSFLGVISVLFLTFRFEGSRSKIYLIVSLVIYYLAMLSKETAITAIVLIPAAFYFFKQKSISDSILKVIPFVVVVLIFYFQKNLILGEGAPGSFNELNNYPYAHSKFSSSMVIFLHLVRLLIFPHPLMYDYSYNQIPASAFSNPIALLGLMLFGVLLYFMWRGFLKKKMWGFSLVVFFTTLLPALAFVWLRGGILAERFLYAASLGYCIALVYFIAQLLKAEIRDPKPVPVQVASKDATLNVSTTFFSNKKLVSTAALALVIFFAFSFKTIDRNKAWVDNVSLFATDIVHAPNSAQNNRHYGHDMLELAIEEKDSTKRATYSQKALLYLSKAVAINPRFGEALGDLGRIYTDINFKPDSAIYFYKKCIHSTPGAAIAYNNLGVVYQALQKYELASYFYNRAIEINPTFIDAQQRSAELKKAGGFDVHVYPGGENPIYETYEFDFPKGRPR